MDKSEGHHRLAELEQKREDLEEKVQDLTREHKTIQQALQRVSLQVIKLRPTRDSERIKLVAAPPTKHARKEDDEGDEVVVVVVDPNQLAELKKKQWDLEERAESLSQELQDVEHALKTVSLQVITLTNELAPITSLPTEILGAIFAEACNFVTLGRVIHRWREIVNDTPQFWSTVEFSILRYYFDPSLEEYRLNLALERSSQFPLDVNFTLCWNGFPHIRAEARYAQFEESNTPSTSQVSQYPRSFLARYLKALMSHAHRIRSLTITTLWHGALYQILTAFLDITAPLLERIVIDIPQSNVIDDDSPRPFVFLKGGAPMLKSIELTNLMIPHCRPPLKSVTHLSLTKTYGTPIDNINFGKTLTGLTSLESLRLLGKVFADYPESTLTIPIPTLRSLYISNARAGVEVVDMKYFYLPNLETLDATQNESHISASSPLPRFPNVRTLRNVARISKGLSSNFPQVTDLYLAIVDTASAELGDLHSWPLLRHLAVSYGDSMVLRKILNERIASDHPIITLSLMCPCGLGRTLADPLWERRDETDWFLNYKSHSTDSPLVPYTLHWQGKHGQYRTTTRALQPFESLLTLYQLTTPVRQKKIYAVFIICGDFERWIRSRRLPISWYIDYYRHHPHGQLALLLNS